MRAHTDADADADARADVGTHAGMRTAHSASASLSVSVSLFLCLSIPPSLPLYLSLSTCKIAPAVFPNVRALFEREELHLVRPNSMQLQVLRYLRRRHGFAQVLLVREH